jgi:hypothetical protein
MVLLFLTVIGGAFMNGTATVPKEKLFLTLRSCRFALMQISYLSFLGTPVFLIVLVVVVGCFLFLCLFAFRLLFAPSSFDAGDQGGVLMANEKGAFTGISTKLI